MSACLIITSEEDTHADAVIDSASRDGDADRLIRLNTESLLSNVRMRFTDGDWAIDIRDSGRTFRGCDIGTVWFRRPETIDVSHIEEECRDFALAQATAALRGLYFSLHDCATWVNPLPSMHRARNKIQQLALARRLGMRVPDTIVTNDAADAMQFVARHEQVCVKSLESPSVRLSDGHWPLFTRLVSVADVEEGAASLRACPSLFQQFIQKQLDIRVVIMGETALAFEIHSQEDPTSAIDFRGLAPQRLEHRPHSLPELLSSQLIEFARRQGLCSCSIDLVRDRSKDYWFLENNPNGQWLWLQLTTGIDLVSRMLRILLPR